MSIQDDNNPFKRLVKCCRVYELAVKCSNFGVYFLSCWCLHSVTQHHGPAWPTGSALGAGDLLEKVYSD